MSLSAPVARRILPPTPPVTPDSVKRTLTLTTRNSTYVLTIGPSTATLTCESGTLADEVINANVARMDPAILTEFGMAFINQVDKANAHAQERLVGQRLPFGLVLLGRGTTAWPILTTPVTNAVWS